MTRLEALLSYTPAQKRDSWISLGSQNIDDYTKVFVKGSLVRLVESGMDILLNGSIFYVTEDFTDVNFQWENYTISDPVKGTISKNSINHPYLRIILTGPDFNAITTDFDPLFIPFANTSASVIIDDDELENILFEVGVPFIAYEELEFSREQILKNAVLPALKEYFKWFPIIEIEAYPMGAGGRFDIDLPPYAYTAQRVYLVPGFGLDVNSQNPFYRSWAQSNTGFGMGTTFGNPHDRALRSKRRYRDIQGFNTYILERAARQGAINYGKRTRIKVNIQKGKVTGFLNQIGSLEVEWAVMSNDWADVPFNRKQEVKDLAKAYILRGLGMLRSQTPKDIPGIPDYSSLITRADILEPRVLNLWQSATKAVVVRS
jgi:hypothetical protein